jgi:CheY-like chemotaxis protein
VLPAVRGLEASPPWVLLRVRDSGKEEHLQGYTCEPWFTARSPGQGLASVAALVQQLGGCLAVDSAPTCGSSCAIFLPPGQAPAAPPPPRSRSSDPGTVLLVDDTKEVRMALQRLLALLGYQVLPAASGAEALALAESAADPGPAPINLLVTDLVMPHMSGQELARRLHARWPGLPVLFVSGYSVSGIDAPADLPFAFLPKPFTLSVLLDKVQEVLHRTGR